jgi:acetylornithine deacetylase/succinyl-diaminopimelate desuccinylase-like protein
MRITLALLPGSDAERELERLLPPWMTAGVRIVVDPDPSGRVGSDPAHPFLGLLGETLDRRYGETLSGPYVLGASATDSRYFRAAGLQAFGFTPFLAMTTDTLGIAGPNEGLALPAFLSGVELYRDVVRQAAGGEPVGPKN